MPSESIANWSKRYDLMPGGGQDCCGIGAHSYGFVALGEAIVFARAQGLGEWPIEHVWTITHGDGDEDDEDAEDVWYINAGVHRVNVIAFVVTRKAHTGTEVIEWD